MMLLALTRTRSSQHTLKFTSGDNIEACTVGGEHFQDGQRRVGFDRVADEVVAATECGLKKLKALEYLVAGVDVERRAEASRKLLERNFSAVQRAVN